MFFFNLVSISLGSKFLLSIGKTNSKIGIQTNANIGVAHTQTPLNISPIMAINGIENAARYFRSFIYLNKLEL